MNTHPEQWAAMLQRPGSSWGFGALLKDTSVVVLKEDTPPTNNPCRTWDSNPQPSAYKSDSLSIRPRLPKKGQEGPRRVKHSLMLQKEKPCIKSWGVKTCVHVYIFLFCPNIIFFSFSTALQKLQKMPTCFPEDKISYFYPDLQIQKVFTSPSS